MYKNLSAKTIKKANDYQKIGLGVTFGGSWKMQGFLLDWQCSIS